MKLPQFSPLLRLATSGALVFGVLAAVAGVSSALLTTNTVTAAPNTFSTGTASLEIGSDSGGGPVGYGLTIPGPTESNLVPGDTRVFTFWLRNTSSTAIDLHLIGDLANYVFKNGATVITDGDTDLDSKMKVIFNCDVEGSSNDGSTLDKTLTSWSTSTPSGDEKFDQGGTAVLGSTPATDEAKCTMSLKLDSTSVSTNHTAIFDAIFHGEQVPPV